MVGQHRLHILEHGVKVVAIDGGVVVAVLFRKAMREIASAAGIHELALPAFFAEIDRGVARSQPARLTPDLIDRMLEDVKFGLREAIARDAQHVVGLDRAVGHDGTELDRLVADALGRRIVAEQGGDHVGNDADVDRGPAAVRLQPQREQAVIERGDRGGLLVHRRVGDHDVVIGDAAGREEFDIILRQVSGIADRERADADVACHEFSRGTFDRFMRPSALERLAVNIMNMRRPVQTDRDGDAVETRSNPAIPHRSARHWW